MNKGKKKKKTEEEEIEIACAHTIPICHHAICEHDLVPAPIIIKSRCSIAEIINRCVGLPVATTCDIILPSACSRIDEMSLGSAGSNKRVQDIIIPSMNTANRNNGIQSPLHTHMNEGMHSQLDDGRYPHENIQSTNPRSGIRNRMNTWKEV